MEIGRKAKLGGAGKGHFRGIAAFCPTALGSLAQDGGYKQHKVARKNRLGKVDNNA